MRVELSANGLCNSRNIGTSDLPDMYAQSLRAEGISSDLPDMYAQSPMAEGIHIRQITRAYVTTNM